MSTSIANLTWRLACWGRFTVWPKLVAGYFIFLGALLALYVMLRLVLYALESKP